MLALARNRAGTGRVTYRHADALTLRLPPGEYDLIVSHFFFDCFEERDAALLDRALSRKPRNTQQAQWLVSEFRAAVLGRTLPAGAVSVLSGNHRVEDAKPD